MQVGLVTVDGRPVGVVTFEMGDQPDMDTPSFDDGSSPIQQASFTSEEHQESGRSRGTTPKSQRGRNVDRGTGDDVGVGDPAPEQGGERVYGSLAAARDRAREELKAKPWLNEKATHIIAGENPEPRAATSIWEETINRMAVRGTTLEHELRHTSEGGYYAGYARNVDPKTRATINAARERALNYSNLSNYATDNSSGDLAAREQRSGTFLDRQVYHGEHFKGPDTRIPQHQKTWRNMINESESGRKSAEKDKEAMTTPGYQFGDTKDTTDKSATVWDPTNVNPTFDRKGNIKENRYPWMTPAEQRIIDNRERNVKVFRSPLSSPDAMRRAIVDEAFEKNKDAQERGKQDYSGNPLSQALGIRDISRQLQGKIKGATTDTDFEKLDIIPDAAKAAIKKEAE